MSARNGLSGFVLEPLRRINYYRAPRSLTGRSDGFDALQVKRLPVSPERAQLIDFRALESVTLADL